MNGVYINIYYDGKDRHGDTCIRVRYVHTGKDDYFCETMRNPHSIAKIRRSRRWRR